MKPLQLLDHVMLWIARMFLACLMLPLLVILLLNCYFVLKSGAATNHESATAIRVASYSATVSLFVVLLSLCVRYTQSGIARILLGLSSLLIVIAAVYCATDELFITHPVEDTHFDRMIAVVLMAITGMGFSAMLWTAIRPADAYQPSKDMNARLVV